MQIFNVLRDKTFNQKLFSLTFPIVLQSLMHAMVAAADAVMLGRVNQDAMAAVSLATQIQFIQTVVLWGISAGIMILGAQYFGKKDIKVLRKILGLSIQDALLVSVPVFLACFFFPEKLMLIFAHDPILIQNGAEYLKTASWSYLLTGVTLCYLSIMRVSEHVTASALISSSAVVLNIVFNYIFIFGCFGIPAMGVKGAAAATVLARIIEGIWCFWISFGKGFIRLRIRDLVSFNLRLTLDFWKYALPVLGACLLWGIGFTAYTAIMGHMGRDAAAANSIAAVVRDLICCLCNGIASGSAIIIGNELGAGKLHMGKLYGKRIVIISFLIGFFSSFLVLLSIPFVNTFLKLTDQAKEYMIGMFLILAVYMVGKCVCTVVINGILSAGGDTMFDVYSLAVCMWGIALPCAFLGAFWLHLPVLAVYAFTCLDELGKIPWLIYHYQKYKWVKNITRDF